MNQNNAKRTPVTGRVRLALLMLATIFSHYFGCHTNSEILSNANQLENVKKLSILTKTLKFWLSHILLANTVHHGVKL